MPCNNRKLCYTFVAFAFLFAVPHASAQLVIPALDSASQALVGRDDKGFMSCGFRSVVNVDFGASIRSYDFSVSLYRDTMGALMKAGSHETPRKDVLAGRLGKVNPLTPTTFWMSPANSGTATMPDKVVKSDDKGFILGSADLVPALKLIEAMMSAEALQFAVRYPNEKLDRVVAYTASLTEGEKQSIASCLGGLGDAWSKTLNASK